MKNTAVKQAKNGKPIFNRIAFKIFVPLFCVAVVMFFAIAVILKISENYYNGFFEKTETKLLYDKFKLEMQTATELAVSVVQNITHTKTEQGCAAYTGQIKVLKTRVCGICKIRKKRNTLFANWMQ